MRLLLYLFALLLLPNITLADFSFNDNCIKAYNSIISLRLNEGQTFLNAERKINPSNNITILLENYIDFFKVLTTETNASFEYFKNKKSANILKIEKDVQKNSPWYLYAIAEINLQSCINRFKYQEYVTGVYELQKAYKLLEENRKKFPDFLPNQKSFALLYSLVGLVPEEYKWALSTIGLKGNIQEGIEMLERLKNKLPSSNYSYFTAETIFFLSVIQLTVENTPNIYETVVRNTASIPNTNLLKIYICANVALRFGHADDAIELLVNRPKSAAYCSFHHLDYLLACAKQYRFDNDAVNYFETYLKNYEGNFNVKDSYLKIAYYYLLKGNIDKYNAYAGLCKVRGQAISDRDKSAVMHASETHAPELPLLKAKFYYDGGYYKKALDVLTDKKLDNIPLTKDKVEYLFRMGTIQQALNNTDQAIIFYTATIAKGTDLKYQYAVSSSFRLGNIYETRKQKAKAAEYYAMCLKMKNEEYKNSFESKAKAGLRRVTRTN
jgi:hypothetical protein